MTLPSSCGLLKAVIAALIEESAFLLSARASCLHFTRQVCHRWASRARLRPDDTAPGDRLTWGHAAPGEPDASATGFGTTLREALSVTPAEAEAMTEVLDRCPDQ